MENKLVLFVYILCTVGIIILMFWMIISSCCFVIRYVNSTSYLNTVDEERQAITMSALAISRNTEDHEMSQHQQFNTDQCLVEENSNQ